MIFLTERVLKMPLVADEHVFEAVTLLKQRLSEVPAVGIVMGSGLGGLVDEMESPIRIPYTEIPHFPVSSVKGHAGEVVAGTLSGVHLFALSGRVHYYEGYPLETVVFSTRVLASLGVKTLIVTNAAGGIKESFLPGDIIVISDHINLINAMALSPPTRMQTPIEIYDPGLRNLANCSAVEMGVTLKTGVYAAVSGPSYETPAEIRALGVMGADMVGMSTVPEATEAHRLGMKVLGFSFITNQAAGLSKNPLSHQEVIETSANHLPTVKKLLRQVIRDIDYKSGV
jgi:purine-nucleoside phosphorylase